MFSFKNTTLEDIKNYLLKVHDSFYDYSNFTEYVNSEYPITIVCPVHGEFKQSAYLHSKGHKCKRCSQEEVFLKHFTKNKDNFIQKFSSKFKNNLVLVSEYYNNSTTIQYKCTSCEEVYENIPNKLLAKNNVGCAFCYGNGKHKQTKEYFNKYRNLLVKEKGFVYLVKLYNERECFLKIGTTKHEDYEKRFEKVPYKKEILIFNETNAYNCFAIEQAILERYKSYQYYPKIYFGGFTECLSLSVERDVSLEIELYFIEMKK